MKNLLVIAGFVAGAWLFLAFWGSPAELFFGEYRTRTKTIPGASSYMEKIVTSKFDEDGMKAYVLRADTGLYYTDGDRFELTEPRLVARRGDDTPPWRLTADSANTAKGGDNVHLSGDVHAWQDTPGEGRSEFYTDELTFHPQENTASTLARVTLIHPEGTTRAVGLEADFTARIYRLLSNVRGQYHVQ